MNKIFKCLLFFVFTLSLYNCSSDDDNCPDSIIVDINDPDTISQAEACGLSPAGTLGNLWVSENYRHENNLLD